LGCLGCGDPYAGFGLGPAQGVVSGCVDRMGGLRRWQAAGTIRAFAVVTVYDDSGAATVNKHDQVIDLRRGRITASATVPEGRWRAVVNAAGDAKFRAGGAVMAEGLKDRLLAALGTTLHRVRGPMNLCGYGQSATGLDRVRVDGREMFRVPATGGASGIVAYYFDAQTFLLTCVTTGSDKAGGDGTVTQYTYTMGPEGMVFPTRIRVTKIGEHTLIGDRPVLSVDYQNVRF